MQWYLIHTKPRQEERALLNLERQGYECFLPRLAVERLRRGKVAVVDEPLFPRYLFIRLDSSGAGKSWGPLRSTFGVSQVVAFGTEPARVDDRLIALLRAHQGDAAAPPRQLFSPGDRVRVGEGPFAGIEAVYEMPDGARRATVLIELLGRTARLAVPVSGLEKTR